MTPLLGRAEELLASLGSSRASASVYPDGLTQREVEVLGLIALGKSNNDIAEELFISLRTLANHVTNILKRSARPTAPRRPSTPPGRGWPRESSLYPRLS